MSKSIPSLVLAIITTACGATPPPEEPVARFTGDYLGKTPPGPTAEIFDAGELTGERRIFNIAFSPNGDELFFSFNKSTPDGDGPDYEIRHMRRIGDGWTEPETAWFSGTFSDCDLTFSPDGSRLFFASELRLHPVTGSLMDIYAMQRTADGWSDPVHAGEAVNTVDGEVHASLSARGNLFFRSGRPGGYGHADIWRAELVDGKFVNAQNIGPAVNTEHMETDCFISADESYLLYNTIRPEHGDKPQIYVSFQTDDGEWTTGMPLGPEVNCEAGTMGSVVSPDGKYLFFTSRRSGDRAVHWISTEVVTRLRDDAIRRHEVRQTIEYAIGWAIEKDFEKMFTVWAQDEDLYQHWLSSNSTTRGFDEFKAHSDVWRDPKFKGTTYEFHDLEIVFSKSGDVAWYSCRLDDCYTYDGQPGCVENVLQTGVLEERGGRWVHVLMHGSYPVDEIPLEMVERHYAEALAVNDSVDLD